MSTQSQATALTLHEILLGIADSLTQAQMHLKNMPPYDEYGRPNTMYQLPYLDFNLMVTSEFESVSVATTNSRKPDNAPILAFLPASGEVSSSNTSKIVSTLSGRFVAVAPNDGLPPIVLDYNIGTPELYEDFYELEVEVMLSNTVGEKLGGTKVEFNYDEEKTALLNTAPPGSPPLLSIAEGNTDEEGIFSTVIKLPANDYNNDKTYVFTVNSGTVSKLISISKS